VGVDDSEAYRGNPNYGVIVAFLRGDRPDWDGRWLADIRTWDHVRLEQDHHYIQWLFPLTSESEAVFAPRLREFEVDELRNDAKLQGELIASLRQILGFFGFDLMERFSSLRVSKSHDFIARSAIWITPGNHNYLRISRILGSLTLAGLKVYSAAFLDALESLYETPEGSASIDRLALWYWRQRAHE
jgi:hypothetical protein